MRGTVCGFVRKKWGRAAAATEIRYERRRGARGGGDDEAVSGRGCRRASTTGRVERLWGRAGEHYDPRGGAVEAPGRALRFRAVRPPRRRPTVGGHAGRSRGVLQAVGRDERSPRDAGRGRAGGAALSRARSPLLKPALRCGRVGGPLGGAQGVRVGSEARWRPRRAGQAMLRPRRPGGRGLRPKRGSPDCIKKGFAWSDRF